MISNFHKFYFSMVRHLPEFYILAYLTQRTLNNPFFLMKSNVVNLVSVSMYIWEIYHRCCLVTGTSNFLLLELKVKMAHNRRIGKWDWGIAHPPFEEFLGTLLAHNPWNFSDLWLIGHWYCPEIFLGMGFEFFLYGREDFERFWDLYLKPLTNWKRIPKRGVGGKTNTPLELFYLFFYFCILSMYKKI